MTKEAKILGKHIVITGFRKVKIEDVQSFFRLMHERIGSSHVQLFDADLVASPEHLYFAALNAIRAFETGVNISKDLVVETLLYASGQNQIRKAVETFGVKAKSSNVAVLIIGETEKEAKEALENVSELLPGEVSDEVLEFTPEKIEKIRKVFNISDLEEEAASRGENRQRTITNLVIEHMALLCTRR